MRRAPTSVLSNAKLAPHVTATGHPSAVLRARDSRSRAEVMRTLVDDLIKVGEVLNGAS